MLVKSSRCCVWRLTLIMSNVCTYLKSIEFKSFKIIFNLSRCRLKSADAFSQMFIKFSIDRNKLSSDNWDDGFIFVIVLNLLNVRPKQTIVWLHLTFLQKHSVILVDISSWRHPADSFWISNGKKWPLHVNGTIFFGPTKNDELKKISLLCIVHNFSMLSNDEYNGTLITTFYLFPH